MSFRFFASHLFFQDLPNKFYKKHLKQLTHDRFIPLVSEGRTWAVKLKSCGKGRARFYSSWKNFVEENGLEIDDVCIFVLIKSFKPSFDVVFHCTAQKAAKSTLNNWNRSKADRWSNWIWSTYIAPWVWIFNLWST